MRNKTAKDQEKLIERYLVKEIEKLGGIAYKFSSPNRRFVPDRLCIIPGPHCIFVECKSSTGILSSGQMREITRLQNMNCQVNILSSKVEVTEFINRVKEIIDVTDPKWNQQR